MVGELVGNAVAGGAGLDPSIRNVSLTANAVGQIVATYELEAENGTDNHRVAAYLDGIAQADVRDGDPVEVGPVGDGSHDIDLLVVRESDSVSPTFSVDRIGTRVLLRWTASSASDVRAYRLYDDQTDGSVDYGTTVATVDAIDVQRIVSALPDSGTGTGRVNISGDYVGDGENIQWSVKITGSGTYQYNDGSGYTGTDLDFFPGIAFNLPKGVRVSFLDALATYATNDTWNFWVGPRTWYMTDELAEGTWKFGLKAVDAAGNVSSSPAETTVEVVADPAPVTGVSTSYDDATGEITITWTDGADTDEVRIYSNWNRVFSALDEYVMETNPLATVAGGVETYTVDVGSGNVGVVLFYLRAADAAGNEEQNQNLVTVNAYTVPFSEEGAPFNLQGEPGPAGVANLSWQYDFRVGEPVSFNLYTFTSAPTVEADFEAATPASIPATYADTTGDIGTVEYTTSALAGVRYFAVRSVDSTGGESDNLDYVTVTPDSTAPASGTSFTGATI